MNKWISKKDESRAWHEGVEMDIQMKLSLIKSTWGNLIMIPEGVDFGHIFDPKQRPGAGNIWIWSDGENGSGLGWYLADAETLQPATPVKWIMADVQEAVKKPAAEKVVAEEPSMITVPEEWTYWDISSAGYVFSKKDDAVPSWWPKTSMGEIFGWMWSPENEGWYLLYWDENTKDWLTHPQHMWAEKPTPNGSETASKEEKENGKNILAGLSLAALLKKENIVWIVLALIAVYFLFFAPKVSSQSPGSTSENTPISATSIMDQRTPEEACGAGALRFPMTGAVGNAMIEEGWAGPQAGQIFHVQDIPALVFILTKNGSMSNEEIFNFDVENASIRKPSGNYLFDGVGLAWGNAYQASLVEKGDQASAVKDWTRGFYKAVIHWFKEVARGEETMSCLRFPTSEELSDYKESDGIKENEALPTGPPPNGGYSEEKTPLATPTMGSFTATAVPFANMVTPVAMPTFTPVVRFNPPSSPGGDPVAVVVSPVPPDTTQLVGQSSLPHLALQTGYNTAYVRSSSCQGNIPANWRKVEWVIPQYPNTVFIIDLQDLVDNGYYLGGGCSSMMIYMGETGGYPITTTNGLHYVMTGFSEAPSAISYVGTPTPSAGTVPVVTEEVIEWKQTTIKTLGNETWTRDLVVARNSESCNSLGDLATSTIYVSNGDKTFTVELGAYAPSVLKYTCLQIVISREKPTTPFNSYGLYPEGVYAIYINGLWLSPASSTPVQPIPTPTPSMIWEWAEWRDQVLVLRTGDTQPNFVQCAGKTAPDGVIWLAQEGQCELNPAMVRVSNSDLNKWDGGTLILKHFDNIGFWESFNYHDVPRNNYWKYRGE